mmetsp:Transcript_10209/g.19353  ORF Transcript_10209/g.19353 Transcript_10209/m.19353 type:complete len:114 (-) Transcript_10209:205-546(-)
MLVWGLQKLQSQRQMQLLNRLTADGVVWYMRHELAIVMRTGTGTLVRDQDDAVLWLRMNAFSGRLTPKRWSRTGKKLKHVARNSGKRGVDDDAARSCTLMPAIASESRFSRWH